MLMFQPNAAVPSDTFVSPPAPTECDSYNHVQSIFAGIILIIVGKLSIIFNIIGALFLETNTIHGHGVLCGIMVSYSLSCFVL